MPAAGNRESCGDLGTPLEQLARALHDADDALQKLQSCIGSPISPDVATLLPSENRLSSSCAPTRPSTRQGRNSEASISSEGTPRTQHGFRLLDCWEARRSQLGSVHWKGCPTLPDTQHRTSEFDVTAGPATHLPPEFLKLVIIHPHGTIRFTWDILSLIVVLYDMFVIPLYFFDIEETPFLNTMNWITRIFWSSDMLVSFNSGYMQADGVIEMRPRRIIVKYICTWFFLDSCIVGIDWLELVMKTWAQGLGFARFGKASRIFRILRLLRLLRLARMKEVWELLCERFDSQTLVIILDSAKLLVVMCAMGHLVGSLFYAVGKMHDDDVNWIKVYDFSNKSTEFKYIMSLRWAISQFAGGMDEVTPTNIDESIYAGIIFFSAYWCGAVFLSVLTSSMTEFCLQGTQQRQKLTLLRHYLTTHGISNKLGVRVNRNAAHAVRMKEKTQPEGVNELMLLVSEPLQREIHFEMYAPFLGVHPFLNSYIDACPHVMRRVCHNAVSMSAESPGDIIFNVGEAPENPRMHIVTKGSLAYSSWSGEETTLIEKDWIAEATLWVEWMYRGSLTVSQDSLLCKVDARKFQQTCTQFEHGDFDPREHASAFVALLNEAGDDLSDMPPKDTKRPPWSNTSTHSSKLAAWLRTASTKTNQSLRSNNPKLSAGHANAVAAMGRTLFTTEISTSSDTRRYESIRTGRTNESLNESWFVKDMAKPSCSPSSEISPKEKQILLL